ncbi:MAG: hypothetical protein WC552_02625 [Candidatus Omnitrophota bacterium]
MEISEEKAEQILQDVLRKGECEVKIRAIVYREDYKDFLVVVGKAHYCQIREKLITDYIEFQHIDVQNEIIYLFNHPLELDEFQKAEMGITDDDIDEDDLKSAANKDGKGSVGSRQEAEDEKNKIIVEDDEKYDWMK